MKQVIGIDLGGTAIKFGCFQQDGTCVLSKTVPTPQPSTPRAVLEAIVKEIEEIQSQSPCLAVGLGTPGPADAAGRIAKVAINLVDWQDVAIADYVEKSTSLPTIIANDANCAGLGEAWLGAGKKFQNLLLLTLGTGVGGAIILNGQLFTGPRGAGGELGLITINYDGPACNSGNQGSLEQYISIPAIRRQTGKEPAQLAQLALAGDQGAIAFWQEYGRLLGVGLASLIYIFTPEAILIGGGISASADLFFPATLQEIERRVLPTSRLGLQLLPAQLGNQAGMVGAAKLAWDLLESQKYRYNACD